MLWYFVVKMGPNSDLFGLFWSIWAPKFVVWYDLVKMGLKAIDWEFFVKMGPQYTLGLFLVKMGPQSVFRLFLLKIGPRTTFWSFLVKTGPECIFSSQWDALYITLLSEPHSHCERGVPPFPL